MAGSCGNGRGALDLVSACELLTTPTVSLPTFAIPKLSRRGMIAVLIGVLAVGIGAVSVYPPPTCDETGYAVTAQSIFSFARLRPTPSVEIPLLRESDLIQHGRLYGAGLMFAFRALGLSLLSGRVYSLVGWLVAGYATYLVGKTVFNHWVGIWAALVFMGCLKAFLTSHLIRPEIWTIALVLLVFRMIMHAIDRGSLRFSLLSGLISVAPFDVHGNAVVFLISYGLVFAWEVGWRRRQFLRAAVYGMGMMMGGAVWIALHVWWPANAISGNFLEMLTSHTVFSGGGAGTGFLDNLSTIPAFITTAYWSAGSPLGLLEAVFGVVGLIVLAGKSDWRERMLINAPLISFVAYGLIFSQRFVQYSVLWSPFLFLAGFGGLYKLAEQLSPKRVFITKYGPAALNLTGVALTSINLAGNLWLTYRFGGGNFSEMSVALNQFVRPGALVIGDPVWWWPLHQDRVFVSDENVAFTANSAEIRAGAGHTIKPDYVLLDSAIGCINPGGPGLADAQAYVANYCERVGQIDGAWVGEEARRFNILGQSTVVYQCVAP
ncbi:MAG: glycosyltransferase family 39 protein [Chloroflexi bacterium]|nr:glycosyltransferase family 39 protein [Chloroflexota bacterium]